MKLKLKENPREWQKFTASVSVLISIAVWILDTRGLLPVPAGAAWTVPGIMVLTCLVQPRLFRGFYRIGMTVGFILGQTIGQLLLVLLFFALVTPIGWLLRLTGKDLLKLKRRVDAATYWHEPKKNLDFDRQF